MVTTCLRERGARDFTYGITALHNDAHRAYRITDVSLVGARGFTLANALVVPVSDSLVGDWSTFPPPAQARDGVAWSQRHRALGAAETAAELNLVVHLIRKDRRHDATIAAVRIAYRTEEGEFETASTSALRVGGPRC